jgi:hypothetical protein
VRRLLTPRWLLRHCAALVLVAGCLGLGWWQVQRARSGNFLSYGYAVQWPVFAGFVVVIWVYELRRALRNGAAPTLREPLRITPKLPSRPPAVRVPDEPPDPELAAYNRYLQWLAANPGRRRSEYPG